jgi:hypothetical protein
MTSCQAIQERARGQSICPRMRDQHKAQPNLPYQYCQTMTLRDGPTDLQLFTETSVLDDGNNYQNFICFRKCITR